MGIHRPSRPVHPLELLGLEAPPYPHNVGKTTMHKGIDGEEIYTINEGEFVRPQGRRPHRKLIYLQKLRHKSDNRIEYRFTYYMLSAKKGRMFNHWVFGQFSLMIPTKDLAHLLKKAQEAGWEGF